MEVDRLYAIAAILTPKYNKRWCTISEQVKWDSVIVEEVNKFIQRFPLDSSENNVQTSYMEPQEPNRKKIKLLSFMESQDSVNLNKFGIEQSLQEYYKESSSRSIDNLDTGNFWKLYSACWPELAAFAKYILNIPASSAPVERIFSIGGAILRPSRRRINDELFRQLIF